MKLPWEYHKLRNDYTVRTELEELSIWVNISCDQIIIDVDDDNDTFSYGNFITTKDLEKRVDEIEALIDNIPSRDLVGFCSQLLEDMKTLKKGV